MISSRSLKGWGLVLSVLAALAIGTVLAGPASLQVKVKYVSEGTVDENHAIHVFIWDTPNIQMGVIPIANAVITENGGTAKFSSLTTSPVYISVCWDEQGGYQVMGPPPSGTPAALYSDTPGVAKAVELEEGKENKVEFEFNDAFRMP